MMFKYKPARSFKHLIFCFFVKKTVPCTMYKLVSTIFGAVFCHQERSVVTYSVPGLHFALPTYSIREYAVTPWKILKLMWKLVLIVWTCRWGPLWAPTMLESSCTIPFPNRRKIQLPSPSFVGKSKARPQRPKNLGPRQKKKLFVNVKSISPTKFPPTFVFSRLLFTAKRGEFSSPRPASVLVKHPGVGRRPWRSSIYVKLEGLKKPWFYIIQP